MSITISKKQILNRWDILPDSLKEAIFSPFNVDLIWSVGAINHLTDDKIFRIEMLAGDILMGFIHPEDFAPEIRKELNINSEMANAIAAEIDRKVFSPLGKDLKSVYGPPAPEFKELEEESGAPILNLRDKMEKFSFKVVEDEDQKQENKIDLSKEVKKENVLASQAEPTIIEKTVPVIEEAVEEEEKKEKEPEISPELISFEAPTEALVPAAPVEPLKEEGPLIIHQETEFKPLSGRLKSLGGMFNFLRSKDEFKKEEEPVRAELEIGEDFKIAEEPKVEEFKVEEARIEEAKPEPAIEEIEKKEETLGEIKIVNYGEEAEVPKIAITSVEPAKETILDLSKKVEVVPESLSVAKENILEIKPEIKFQQEPGDIKPKIEPKSEQKNEPEETIDLGMFK